MQSLAEYLGTNQAEGAPIDDKKDSPSLLASTTCTAEEFAKAFLNSLEFKKYIVNSLTLGELPPAITTRLMDYAWGKPTEKLEITDKTARFEEMSVPELVQRIRLLQSALETLSDDDSSIH